MNNMRPNATLKPPKPLRAQKGGNWGIYATIGKTPNQKAKTGVSAKPGSTAAVASKIGRPPNSSPLLQ
jgi:hypothetical protein